MDFRAYITEPPPVPPEHVRLRDVITIVQSRPGATEPDSADRADAIERRVIYTYMTAEERHGLGRPLSLRKPPR